MTHILALYTKDNGKLIWTVSIPDHIVSQLVEFGHDDPQGYECYKIEAFIEPEQGHA